MALPRPSPSEADLYNLPTAARLAYIIDQLIAMNTALGGITGITPVNGDNVAIAVGGTAVIAFSGPNKGGYITNPDNLTGQGIAAAEPLYVSLTGTPGSTDAVNNNATFKIAPGGTFVVPAMATGINLKVNGATAGHKFSAVKYT